MILFLMNSCRTFHDLSVNAGMNFSEPKKILNKITNPVNKGVRLSALWVGHATVLLQMDDKQILFDPFFTQTSGGIQRRLYEPGIELKNINKCDLIFISHSHFDHLNFGTLSLLEDKFAGTPLIFPEGVEEYLPDYNFDLRKMKMGNRIPGKYIGETKTISGIKITTVYAFHWGGRYGLDGLLWRQDAYTGYILEYNGMTVYFSGDTAYDEKFYKELGNKFKIDLALIPIGPCSECNKIDKPDRHVYPKGALMILNDLKAKFMIPVHYGTLYELSEDPEEPRYVLQEMIGSDKNYLSKIRILKIGDQSVIIQKE
ncbi:MAG: MBL fold metallo-hydrolase [Ignavibacteria bacterium]|nr:MBL fold metallo-hydrolase [Ignavibacteria bacterium]